jgi:hypothetical protein
VGGRFHRVVLVGAVFAVVAGDGAGDVAGAPARTSGFKYEQEAASDDFLRAVVGCERKKLACPGPTEAVVFTSREDKVIRVFVQRSIDGRLRRPRLPNGAKERVRLLSVPEIQQRVASDPRPMALQYVVGFSSPARARVNVVYQSLFQFGALTVYVGPCGQSDYAISKGPKGWTCGTRGTSRPAGRR